jgi:hypothetical protein
MENDAHLIVSYVLGGLVCFGIGLTAYLWLRHPFVRIADALPRKAWGIVLRKSFPATLVLFALSGFLSVKYDACGTRSYQEIVTDHTYLMAKNQEQIQEASTNTSLAVLLWAAAIVFVLVTIRRAQSDTKSGAEGRN